jgi:flagellar hook-basal body complex protein FliE
MSGMDINQVLAQMRDLAAQSSALPNARTNQTDFQELLANSINEVNHIQQQSNQLASEFESGDTDASLSDVMISIQKANVSFQAMVQVRNKLVEAYKDVMNMPM